MTLTCNGRGCEGCVDGACAKACYPGCEDCKNGCGGPASIPSGKGVETSSGAACFCFPANDACPSEAACAGHPGYYKVVDELRALHAVKSGGYGTGTDPFANFTAVAELSGEPRYLYPVLRSIEKLTRVLSLHAQGRVPELGEEFVDIASLMVCAEAVRREDSPG